MEIFQMNSRMINVFPTRLQGNVKCSFRGPSKCYNTRLWNKHAMCMHAFRKKRRNHQFLDKEYEVDFEDVEIGQLYKGSVIQIKEYGVFVDIGADKWCLVHISELSDDFINEPSDVAELGMSVNVKVINKDSDRRVLGGTFRHPGMNLSPNSTQQE